MNIELMKVEEEPGSVAHHKYHHYHHQDYTQMLIIASPSTFPHSKTYSYNDQP